MLNFDPARYGPRVAALLEPARLAELGPGRPNEAARSQLAALTPSNLFLPQRVADESMAAACLAGLWLYHDFQSESHAISQDLPTASGSYWHGILHRREPDFANAKYWFRRVGQHEIGPALLAHAQQLARGAGPQAAGLLEQATWDHFAFVDLCRSALAGRSSVEPLCRDIQQAEWRLLFESCYRHACLVAGPE